jgi:hypothetical protein
MPMVHCPQCSLRQYAAASHATRGQCVRCGDTMIVASALPRVRAALSTRGGDWGTPDANGPAGEESRQPSPHAYDQRCNHI